MLPWQWGWDISAVRLALQTLPKPEWTCPQTTVSPFPFMNNLLPCLAVKSLLGVDDSGGPPVSLTRTVSLIRVSESFQVSHPLCLWSWAPGLSWLRSRVLSSEACSVSLPCPRMHWSRIFTNPYISSMELLNPRREKDLISYISFKIRKSCKRIKVHWNRCEI